MLFRFLIQNQRKAQRSRISRPVQWAKNVIKTQRTARVIKTTNRERCKSKNNDDRKWELTVRYCKGCKTRRGSSIGNRNQIRKPGKTFCLHCACVVNSLWDVVDGCRWQQMATNSKVSELFIRWKTKSASRYMLNAKDSACMLFAHNAYNSDNTPIKVRKTAWRNI